MTRRGRNKLYSADQELKYYDYSLEIQRQTYSFVTGILNLNIKRTEAFQSIDRVLHS